LRCPGDAARERRSEGRTDRSSRTPGHSRSRAAPRPASSSALVQEACGEYEEGAQCFAAAAGIGIPFAGTAAETRADPGARVRIRCFGGHHSVGRRPEPGRRDHNGNQLTALNWGTSGDAFARHRPPQLRSDENGRLHPRRPDRAHRAAWADSRLRGMPQHWQLVGPPADVPDLRQNRLLRFLAKPPREPPRPPGQPSHRSLGGTRRGLELVLRRSARLRHRHPRPRTRRFSRSVTRIAAPHGPPSRAPVPLGEHQ
jgi:hypothetical protein